MSRKIMTITICLLLAACSLPGTQTTSQPQAWFDMPLPDTVFFPPNPCQIIAHGASSKGIALFEFLINGAIASDIPAPDSKQNLATLNTVCPPLIPGENLIELRVKDNSGLWSETTQTTVFLAQTSSVTETPSPRATDTPVSTLTAIPTLTATLTPTITPTVAPVIGPPDELSITAVSTWVVYVGASSCGPMETSITAHATASKGIAAVILFFRFPGADFQNVSMNPMGNDLYQGTLNMNSILGGSIPFDSVIPEYQIVVQQSDGDTSLRTPLLADIEVKACAPADNTGGTDACSAYPDQRACIANGCNWWEIPGTPPTFVCRSKP